MRRGVAVAWLMCGSLLAGCYHHRIDNIAAYCEQITDVNLEDRHRPFWAVIFSTSMNADAIRDDLVKMLHEEYAKKSNGRIGRPAWREQASLHVVNPSSVFVVEPEKFVEEWRTLILKENARTQPRTAKDCLPGMVNALFDVVYVHSPYADAMGLKWTDRLAALPTHRRERFAKRGLMPP